MKRYRCISILLTTILILISLTDLVIADDNNDNNISYDNNIKMVIEKKELIVIEHYLHGPEFRDILSILNLLVDEPLDLYNTAAFTTKHIKDSKYHIHYNEDIFQLMNKKQIQCIKNHEFGHVLAFQINQREENSDFTNGLDCIELFVIGDNKE